MSEQGFTLIEILVALAIMATITGILVMAANSGGLEPRMRREMERLRARIDYACEQAELTGQDLGLHLGNSGYGFSQRHQKLWVFESKTTLAPYDLPTGMYFESDASVLEKNLAGIPQMFCLASGERSPLRLQLRAGTNPLAFRLAGDWNSVLRIERRDAASSAWTEWKTAP